MQNQPEQTSVTPNPQSNPRPMLFDNQGKPAKEQDSQSQDSTKQHDHGKSHSGL